MADQRPVLTPVIVELMLHLSRVTSMQQHDSMLDDLAKTVPGGPPDLDDKKREFRRIVTTTMKRTGCPEEEAVTSAAQYIYGRMIAAIPTDGQHRRG